MKPKDWGILLLIAAGVIALAFASGAYWQFDRMRHAPAKVTLTYIERPITIPPSIQHQHAIHNPNADSHQSAVDTLIAQAERADSIIQVLKSKLEPWYAEFADTIDIKDSLGRFQTVYATKIEFDPVTEIVTKMVEYINPQFKAAIIEREKFVDLSLWEKLYYALPVAAVIVAIIELTKLAL